MRVEIPNQITVTIGGLISRGVKAVEVTDAGRLVFTLTDGSVIDLGSVMGPQGPKGETGPAGPQGQTGPQGAKGDTGPAGASGTDGITPSIGKNGNWYLGTTDTGKPSRGEKGDPGAAGAKGDQGEQGPRGETGATGAEGPAGKTPVKGTDYFTEADKQEIASAAAELVDLSGKQDKITKSGLLKGDGTGGVSTAVPGTDYMAPIPVTASDNGKFLRVVSGAWAAVEIANANGGSF